MKCTFDQEAWRSTLRQLVPEEQSRERILKSAVRAGAHATLQCWEARGGALTRQNTSGPRGPRGGGPAEEVLDQPGTATAQHGTDTLSARDCKGGAPILAQEEEKTALPHVEQASGRPCRTTEQMLNQQEAASSRPPSMAGLNAELAAPNNGIPGSDATTNPEAFYRYAQSLPNQLPSLPYHVAQFNGLPHFPPYNQGLPQIPRHQYAPRPIAVTHDTNFATSLFGD